MIVRASLLSIACYLGSLGSICAQGSAVDQLYGEGVHRYFSRDYVGAEQALSRAIEAGSQDPRVYYFRGLARAAYGGPGEVDYQEGARFESSGRTGVNVGFALTRIQGYERAKIEKARHDARLLVQQQRTLMQQAMPVAPIPTVPGPVAPPESTDPFTGDGLRSEEVEVAPTPPAEPEVSGDSATNPFADEPAPSVVDPFSDPPATDAPPSDEVDPFDSSDPPAEVEADDSDPFGG